MGMEEVGSLGQKWQGKNAGILLHQIFVIENMGNFWKFSKIIKIKIMRKIWQTSAKPVEKK